jgi:hypothetical protein
MLREEELVRFVFAPQLQDREVVWILGNFFYIVWSECIQRGKSLNVESVRGLLRARLRTARLRNVGFLSVELLDVKARCQNNMEK